MTECPDDCPDGVMCQVCFDTACPTHGVPDRREGELTPEDTVTHCNYQGGRVHRVCHEQACRSRHCWAEVA